jgi:hypothetical protein
MRRTAAAQPMRPTINLFSQPHDMIPLQMQLGPLMKNVTLSDMSLMMYFFEQAPLQRVILNEQRNIVAIAHCCSTVPISVPGGDSTVTPWRWSDAPIVQQQQS